MEISPETLSENGWTQCPGALNRYIRTHQIDDFLWSEEIDQTSQQRITYIRRIKARRSQADRALGSVMERLAPNLAQLAADYYPMRRTGIGKVRTFRQTEAAFKALSESLQDDLIDEEKQFLIRASAAAPAIELVARDSKFEAQAHVYMMLSLRTPC
jgi:hypothetical protein